MPKESYLQNQVISYLKTLPKAYSYVNHGSVLTGKGRPDVHLLWYGMSIWFELKRDKQGRLSPDQIGHSRMIENAGGFWFAPTTLLQVKEILSELTPLT